MLQRPAAPLWFPALGLALVIAGQPVAWWARGTFTQGESAVFPAAAVLLGLLLMIGLRPVREWRLHADPGFVFAYACLWLLPVAALSLVDLAELGDDSAYAFFLFLVALALALTPLAALDRLPRMVAVIGGAASLLTLAGVVSGDAFESGRLALVGNQNQIIGGMVGAAAMIGAVLDLLHGRRRLREGLVAAVIFGAGFACVLLSNTRSILLALIYTLPLCLWLHARRRPRNARARRGLFAFSGLIAAAIVAAPAAAFALIPPEALDAALELAGKRFRGAFQLFEDTPLRAVDASSQMRIDVFERTFSGLNLLGHGISAQVRAQGDIVGVAVYPHFSYLQAFYDLGALGGAVFFVLHAAVPVALIVGRLRGSALKPAESFAIAFYLFSHMDHFTHTTPYSWLGLLPVVVLYAVLARPAAPGSTASA